MIEFTLWGRVPTHLLFESGVPPLISLSETLELVQCSRFTESVQEGLSLKATLRCPFTDYCPLRGSLQSLPRPFLPPLPLSVRSELESLLEHPSRSRTRTSPETSRSFGRLKQNGTSFLRPERVRTDSQYSMTGDPSYTRVSGNVERLVTPIRRGHRVRGTSFSYPTSIFFSYVFDVSPVCLVCVRSVP